MAVSLRDRRVQLWIVGGVVGILAVFLLMKVLGGSGGTSAESPTAPYSPPAGTLAPTPTPVPSTTVVFSGRDPFQDLFGAASSSGSTSTTSGSSTLPTAGTTTPPTANPPPSGGGSSGQGSGTNIGGHTVLLDDVFVAPGGVRKAQVDVDGTVYTVAAGETFASNFKLVSFPSADCAHFVYGDEAFTLCTSGGK
jgi:hypothetical protein